MPPVRTAKFDSRDLGHRICFVRGFERAREQGVLDHRLFGEARVYAGRPPECGVTLPIRDKFAFALTGPWIINAEQAHA